MDDPQLFQNAGIWTKRDTTEFLEHVKDLLPWSNGERILDVGCGPGDVTSGILTTYLSEGYIITGGDISEKMVKYAQSNFENGQLSFRLMDIADPNIFDNWEKGIYDKIFSFFTFHRVMDLKRAAKNMYNLLKKNGYLVAIFPHIHPIINVLEQLRANEKWHPYTKEPYAWEAIYDPAMNAKEEFMKILKSAEYEIIECMELDKSYVYTSREKLLEFSKAVNSFLSRIPEEKRTEFLEESNNLLFKEESVSINENNEITTTYKLISVIAKKC